MNMFWLGMMISSILVLILTNPSAVLSEMISASSSALSLCIELCAVYAVWMGIIELVDQSGLGEKLSKILRPLVQKLFRVKDEKTQKLISMNISANLLGIGNAATPMGIKAMQALDDKSGVANYAMIMLIIVNVTSIQLLPTTIIGMRASAGSANPADIIFPSIIATFCTTLLGIVLVFLVDKYRSKRKKNA